MKSSSVLALGLVIAGSASAQTTLTDTYLLPQLPAQGPFFWARALDVADVDSDGDLDIAVGHSAYNSGRGAVWICLGPDFETRILATHPTLKQNDAMGTYRITLADFDLDGYCEIVAEATLAPSKGMAGAGRAFLFWGPDYQTSVELPRPFAPLVNEFFGFHHAVGDLTGDGRIDLAVSAYASQATNGWIAVYDGATNFSAVHSYTVSPPHVSGPNWGDGIAIEDIDGDGRGDLVTPHTNYVPLGKVCWAKSGDPNQLNYFPWNPGMPTGEQFKDFRWLDLDADGHRDLICASNKVGTTWGQIFIQYGPTFLTHQSVLPMVSTNQDYAWMFDIGDIDRDGSLDFALGGPQSDPGGRVSIIYGPDYVSKQQYLGGNTNAGLGFNVRVADLDGDGFCEVLASGPGEANGIVHIYRHYTLRVVPPHSGNVSLSAGGSVPLSVEVGKLAAGGQYLLLMSLSGSSPGLDWNAGGATHHLPLNFDALTTIGLNLANSAVCPGFVGQLDASGNAAAALVVPPVPELALWAPQTITIAGVVSHTGVAADYATHAAKITLTP
jgi:FG-GAP-like repeat/FG-GAP repeat